MQNHPAKSERTETKEEATDASIASSTEPTVQQQQQQPKKHHKVKIGHIFHRAHPFTARISNLAPETEEMDIIEAFKQKHKCGPVVHCKIQREKPFHAKGKKGQAWESKGWGLLQFEERDSVEKALELDKKVELHGKSLNVERSHVPAVGIVPPGMHRPKHAKQSGPAEINADGQTKAEEKNGEAAPKPAKPSGTSGSGSLGILAFRPRGVAKKKQLGPKKAHPKVKLALPSKDTDDKTDQN